MSAQGWGTSGATVWTGRGYGHDGSIESRFRAVEAQLADLTGELGKLHGGLNDERAERQADSGRLEAMVQAESSARSAEAAQRDDQADRLQAGVIPGLIWAIVLGGVPDVLAGSAVLTVLSALVGLFFVGQLATLLARSMRR